MFTYNLPHQGMKNVAYSRPSLPRTGKPCRTQNEVLGMSNALTGSFTTLQGDVIGVSYSIGRWVKGSSVGYAGTITGGNPSTNQRLLGSGVLTTAEGKKLQIIIDRPGRFIGSGDFF